MVFSWWRYEDSGPTFLGEVLVETGNLWKLGIKSHRKFRSFPDVWDRPMWGCPVMFLGL